MPLSAEHLQKPFTKLAKAVKSPKKLSDPEQVHKMRTNSRRVEAALETLDLLPGKRTKQFLAAVDKVRRAAGKVRDMDVLTGKVATLSASDERNCQIRLLEHLGAERQRLAKDLARAIDKEGPRIRRGAKQCAKNLSPVVEESYSTAEQKKSEAKAASRARTLSAELQRYGDLNHGNLHEYRKEGKQLRYVLQMSDKPKEPVLNSLREVQDAIGEWHDWEELVAIAKDALDHGRKCGLLRELKEHVDSSFEQAVRMADSMRKGSLVREKKKNVPAEPAIVRATVATAA